jgi:hypothetical protein
LLDPSSRTGRHSGIDKEATTMGRYLIVANQTLGGGRLDRTVQDRIKRGDRPRALSRTSGLTAIKARAPYSGAAARPVAFVMQRGHGDYDEERVT